ncbi:hypothetical protein SAMN05216338_10397 [Bradyrhizobium sp. Rc2d]|nr:hypothetical protein SAMN05216338_10397 [Bradyrhizobium sp. Rc2d]
MDVITFRTQPAPRVFPKAAWASQTNRNIAWPVACQRHPDHIAPMRKKPFRLTPYQVQFLIVVGFVSVGYALYLRYLAIELSQVALACDAGLQTLICKARSVSTVLFKNSVFGIVALVVATLNLMRPSIVLLTVGVIAAGLGIVLYNVVLSGLAIGLFILGFARPAPATA